MTPQTSVFAILPNETSIRFAHQVANAMGYAEAEIVIGQPMQAIPVLQGKTTTPHYIIIDIGTMGSEVLQQLDALAEYCEADTRVIVIGAVNDVTFYRELRQRGIIEYFTHPAKVADVRHALAQPIQTADAKEQAHSRIFTFMSAASGDGSSTVALNTAYSLANDYGRSTVLIDMDYQFGMIAKNLDLSAPFGIRELFEYPDRGVDSTLLERMLVSYGSNMKVISAPNDLRQLPDVQPEVIRDLLLTLREQFECVIIDLPHIWTPWVGAAFSNSTQSIMVAQLWLRSVTHSSRILNMLRSIGVDDETISVVINRSGAKFKEAVSARDYERVCDKPIDFYISNDIRTVVASENRGQTIMEVGRSQLEKQFKEFAGQLIGAQTLDEGLLSPPAKKSKRNPLFGS